MGICVIRFKTDQQGIRWGIVKGKQIAVLPHNYASHRELMDSWSTQPGDFELRDDESLQLDELELLSPISADVQIFCQMVGLVNLDGKRIFQHCKIL